MMTDTDWADERAAEIRIAALKRGVTNAPALEADVAAALREADTRARLAERQAIKARLMEPDVAILDKALSATSTYHEFKGSKLQVNRQKMRLRLRALAAALFPDTQEGE